MSGAGGSGPAGGFFRVTVDLWKELVLPLTNMMAALNSIANSLVSIAASIISASAVVKISGTFTANGTLGTLPAGAMIIQATLQEIAGHSVNVSLGTSSGGAQILPAVTVGASSIVPVPAISMLLQAWTAPQSIFVASGAWGSASITATLWYTK